MINSVFLTGRLGDLLDDKTRYVEVDSVIPGAGGEFKTHRIPIRSTRGSGTRFFRAKTGALISLEGRIETDETYGLIVVLELDEIYAFAQPSQPQ